MCHTFIPSTFILWQGNIKGRAAMSTMGGHCVFVCVPLYNIHRCSTSFDVLWGWDGPWHPSLVCNILQQPLWVGCGLMLLCVGPHSTSVLGALVWGNKSRKVRERVCVLGMVLHDQHGFHHCCLFLCGPPHSHCSPISHWHHVYCCFVVLVGAMSIAACCCCQYLVLVALSSWVWVRPGNHGECVWKVIHMVWWWPMREGAMDGGSREERMTWQNCDILIWIVYSNFMSSTLKYLILYSLLEYNWTGL